MGETCNKHDSNEKAYKVLVEKPEQKKLAETPGSVMKQNIKLDIKNTIL